MRILKKVFRVSFFESKKEMSVSEESPLFTNETEGTMWNTLLLLHFRR